MIYHYSYQGCGGLLKESNQVIQPPIENGVYANNEMCIWTIQAPPGYVIQLTWLSFDLEDHTHCVHDYVNIYENYTSPDEDIIATYVLAIIVFSILII